MPIDPLVPHEDFKRPKKKDDLPEAVPEPGDSVGHVLPYTYDDWRLIERLKGTQAGMVRIKMKCHGWRGVADPIPCDAMLVDVVYAAVADGFVKFLCPECIHSRGFAWGSTITQEEYAQYQQVRRYDDDVLLRRLDQSPNHKEEFHRPGPIPDPLGGKPPERVD